MTDIESQKQKARQFYEEGKIGEAIYALRGLSA
jgi:hypothetical protein